MHEIFKEKKKKKNQTRILGNSTYFFFPKHKFPELLVLGQFVSKWIEGSNNPNEIIVFFQGSTKFLSLHDYFRTVPTVKGHVSGLSTMSTLRVLYHSFLSAHKSLGWTHSRNEKCYFFQMTEVPLHWYFIVIRTSLDTWVEILAIKRIEEPRRD